MEDVLEIYQRTYNPKLPVICMDEKPYQILDESRQAIPMKEGSVRKEDSEYVRNGTCSIFIFTEPLTGWRHVTVCEHRTKIDWAKQTQIVLNDYYPNNEKVILVMDNLNTHNTSSFYQAFEPETARNLARRLEVHYTPKHGSWLNIAEIELSAMTAQCLGRRIPNIEKIRTELAAWESVRNLSQKGVDWHFTNVEARVKLRHLYPIIKM